VRKRGGEKEGSMSEGMGVGLFHEYQISISAHTQTPFTPLQSIHIGLISGS
jgi:hypothetical protein